MQQSFYGRATSKDWLPVIAEFIFLLHFPFFIFPVSQKQVTHLPVTDSSRMR